MYDMKAERISKNEAFQVVIIIDKIIPQLEGLQKLFEVQAKGDYSTNIVLRLQIEEDKKHRFVTSSNTNVV